jgi:hypothetical protein
MAPHSIAEPRAIARNLVRLVAADVAAEIADADEHEDGYGDARN